jgi:hypothetical protein
MRSIFGPEGYDDRIASDWQNITSMASTAGLNELGATRRRNVALPKRAASLEMELFLRGLDLVLHR